VTKPEDLVVTFYRHYSDEKMAEGFFTLDAWDEIGRNCSKGLCGCSTKREDVSRAIVVDYAISLTPKGADVAAHIVCFDKRDKPAPAKTVRWSLVRQEKTWDLWGDGLEITLSFSAIWRLSDAVLMGSGE
jgi:hypothetical protein